MAIEEDLLCLAEQEKVLQFDRFNADLAWAVGGRLRELAQPTGKSVAIGIWLTGQTLLFTGTNGITPGNEDWLRRKRNTVQRFGRSSLRVGLDLQKAGTTLEEKQGLHLSEYAAHGGGFPLLLRGTGCIGAVVVSGLSQREDHAMVVQALADTLQLQIQQLS